MVCTPCPARPGELRADAGRLRADRQSACLRRAAAVCRRSGCPLLRNTTHPQHRLLALDFGFAEVLGSCTGGVVGHRQVTDTILLTAANRSGVKLLTFDAGIRQLLATDAERERHLTVMG